MLLPTNFTEKKSLGAPGMKVSNDSSVGHAVSQHIVYVISGARVFLLGIINIWGFISYCRDSPRVFNFTFLLVLLLLDLVSQISW